MVLVIDNYDSFTFNLVQMIGTITRDVVVYRNDAVCVAQIEALAPTHIVISPGPGRPEDAGITLDLIRSLYTRFPILGVCLGHQAIGMAFGGAIVHAPSLMHGRVSSITHDGQSLFRGVGSPLTATRYHSLVIAPESLPSDLVLTAQTDDGVIMGVRHRRYPTEGVQFHPESILTDEGAHMIRNWLGRSEGR